MPGETELSQLLKNMKPELNPGEYVFCSVPDKPASFLQEALLVFREQEGVTIIIPKEVADNAGLEYSFVYSWITLTVHSSLEAVGLTAAFSRALAKAGISCNVVAAFYHDHIFVEKKEVKAVIEVLNSLANCPIDDQGRND